MSWTEPDYAQKKDTDTKFDGKSEPRRSKY
jgi:hypothetical protein